MAKLTCTPAFTHDCDKCRFRAHVAPATGPAFDLWDGCDGTVIARTSSDGPDYHCMDSSFAPRFAGDVASIMGRAFYVRDLLDRAAAV
jgi:hypothetical protein